MKKKTSLWISGITTVAMLAVAVGSFAAWNTFTASVDQVSTASATPTILSVEKGTDTFTGKKLVPSDVTPAAGEVSTLSVEFTPTLTQDGSGKAIHLKTADLKYNNAANSGTLKMEIYKKDDPSKTPVAVNDVLESGKVYVADVTFVNTDTQWTPETAAAAANKSITLDITCEAEDVTPAP